MIMEMYRIDDIEVDWAIIEKVLEKRNATQPAPTAKYFDDAMTINDSEQTGGINAAPACYPLRTVDRSAITSLPNYRQIGDIEIF